MELKVSNMQSFNAKVRSLTADLKDLPLRFNICFISQSNDSTFKIKSNLKYLILVRYKKSFFLNFDRANNF